MAAVVSLREVAEEMEVCTEGCHSFLNLRTGELYGGPDDCLAAAEKDSDEQLLGWEQEIVARLREVLASADWIALPRRDTIEDYRIMESFCLEQADGEAQEDLLEVIEGRGAFSRFKKAIHQWGIQEDWYRYRSEATLREAAAWLKSRGIEYRK